MVTFEANAPKRTIVIGMKRGDDILEGINLAIKEYGIKQAVVASGIAALSQATFHKVTTFDEKAVNEFITIKSPIELGCMQGTIIDGVPHIHFSFSDADGNSYEGHLEPGTIVLYVCEIVLLEFDGGDIHRKPTETGLMLLAK